MGVAVAPDSNGVHRSKQRTTAALGDTVGRRGGQRWPWLGRSHGGGGARMRRERRGSEVDLRGEGGAGTERASGGEWEMGSRRRVRGDLIPSSTPARGVRRGRAPVPTLVGGTGKGRERPGERAGSAGWARWAGLAASWAVWSRGVIFFSFCFTLSYFSFSVLANCLGTK